MLGEKNLFFGAIVLIRSGGFEYVARGKPTERRVENDQVEPAVDVAEDVAAADFDAVGDTVAQGVVAGDREGVQASPLTRSGATGRVTAGPWSAPPTARSTRSMASSAAPWVTDRDA